MSDSFREAIQQIKDRADLVAIVGRTVTLKRTGKSFKGCCPFHDEKTPSFNVVPDKGIYHCFGCGESGSVIDFIMKTERVEFREAVDQLADELGVELPKAESPEKQAFYNEQDSKRKALEKLNEFALNFFKETLKNNEVPVASELAVKRNIPEEYIEKFELGAAYDDWSKLAHAAMAKGYSRDLLAESGLCILHEQKNSLYDRFRDRLIFPIRDHLGRSIGFGGRRLSDDPNSPKYLNSAETLVYQKSRSLYALNLAKEHIDNSGFVLITEGYMDALMAHRFGFPQAVASLGTALTIDQARLLKRYAARAYFLYDGDSAGVKAMLKGGPALLEAGLDARIIQLPAEHDPDTFLQQEDGPAKLTALMDHAPEFFTFALDSNAEGLELQTLAGQSELVEKMAPIIKIFKNAVQKEGAISRLVQRLGDLPREVVYRILSQDGHRPAPPPNLVPSQSPATGTPEQGNFHPPNRFRQLERFVLKLMLHNFEALQVIREDLDENWVEDPQYSPWILFFLSGVENSDHMISAAELENTLPADKRIVHELMADQEPMGDPEHSARQLSIRLKLEHQKMITVNLLKAIRETYQKTPEVVPEDLLKQIHEEASLARKMTLPNAPMV